jgi:hypothetical protein
VTVAECGGGSGCAMRTGRHRVASQQSRAAVGRVAGALSKWFYETFISTTLK